MDYEAALKTARMMSPTEGAAFAAAYLVAYPSPVMGARYEAGSFVGGEVGADPLRTLALAVDSARSAEREMSFRHEAQARDFYGSRVTTQRDPKAGEPCPRCGEPLLAFSPSGRGTAACDGCQTVWGAE